MVLMPELRVNAEGSAWKHVGVEEKRFQDFKEVRGNESPLLMFVIKLILDGNVIAFGKGAEGVNSLQCADSCGVECG